MGNCMNVSLKEYSTMWGGEEWGSPLPSPPAKRGAAESVFCGGSNAWKSAEEEGNTYTTERKKGTEVKIKISKKQLEELLSTVDARGKCLKQVLTELISLSSDDGNQACPRSWRPALHSIPESEVY